MTGRDQLTPVEAERLLAVVASGTHAGGDPLAVLLRSAVPVIDPHRELPGEADAVAAFRVAAAGPFSARHARPVRWRRSLLRGGLTIKGVVVAAVVAAGGVAVAASAGVVPNPLASSSHHGPAPHATRTGPGGSAVPGRPTPGASPSAAGSPAAAGASTAGTPSGAALIALCQEYLGSGAQRAAAERSVAFPDLAAAAGSHSTVKGYCTALVASAAPGGSSAGGGTTAEPTHPAAPGGGHADPRPTPKSSSHGKPSAPAGRHA